MLSRGAVVASRAGAGDEGRPASLVGKKFNEISGNNKISERKRRKERERERKREILTK